MSTETENEQVSQSKGFKNLVSVASISTGATSGSPVPFYEGLMYRGYIKAWRRFTEWEWYKTDSMFHLFCHLLFKANHKDGRWQGVEVKRGQLITGRKALTKETGLSEQTVRTCLTRLKSTNEVTIKSTKHYSVITICKYDSYQNKDEETNQQVTNKSTNNQPTGNHQLTTNKNDKNVKNDNNKETSLILPDAWNDETKKIWQEWQSYRKPLGQVKNWYLFWQKQVDWLKQFDNKRTQDILNQSIRNGWRGLFEPKLLRANQYDKPQRPPIDWDKFGEEIDRKMGRIP